MKKIDITGERFGRLIVLSQSENKGGRTMWLCKCDCGNEVVVTTQSLRRGDTKSCGCFRRESVANNNRVRKKYDTKKELYRVSNLNRRIKNREFLYSHKTPCIKCGEDRLYVIDFHHINPADKKMSLSTHTKDFSEDIVLNEIKKCVCLCSNCHREFHYIYGKHPSEPIKALSEYLIGGVDVV